MSDISLAMFGPAEFAAAGSALIAVASLLLNYFLIRRQSAIQLEELKSQVDRDILHWASDAIAVLAEAEADVLASSEPDAGMLASISAAADQGRLYFPNLSDDLHGNHKEAAFRGHRLPILDALVYAHHAVERAGAAPERREDVAEFLRRCRRLLVSEVQITIDPRRRREVITNLSKTRADALRPGYEEAGMLGTRLEELFPGALSDNAEGTWTTITRYQTMSSGEPA